MHKEIIGLEFFINTIKGRKSTQEPEVNHSDSHETIIDQVGVIMDSVGPGKVGNMLLKKQWKGIRNIAVVSNQKIPFAHMAKVIKHQDDIIEVELYEHS